MSVLDLARQYVIHPLIDFIYAPVCYHCRGPVPSDRYLCGGCNGSLAAIGKDSDDHNRIRREVIHRESRLADAYTLYEFEAGGVLQSVIHELKYSQMTRAGIDLGRRIGEVVRKAYGVDDTWILCPVPLYPSKRRERGYNQADYIARGIGEVTGGRVRTDLILRVRKTRSQTRLTVLQRRENVANAFEFTGGNAFPPGTNIALIDDIITTGATLSEMAALFPDTVRIYGFGAGYARPEIA
jgi:ComF family protein